MTRQELCAALAEQYNGEGVQVVIGPAMGAVQMAYEVSRALKCENFFTERDENGKMQLRRGFAVGLRLELGYWLLVGCVTLAFRGPILSLFVAGEGAADVVALGSEYLGYMAVFYALPALTNGFQGFYRGMGKMTTTLIGTCMQAGLRAAAAAVLAPRVADEMLTPYRSFLQREIPAADAAAFRRDPQRLVAWCRDSLTLRPELCTVSTTISPEGVWRSRTADKLSRAIFFVAAARSLGIPAWIDRVTGNLFYRHAGKDVPVDFDAAGNRELETGRLQLNYAPIPRLDDPEYFRHFSLSRFDGQSFSLLNYPDFERWSELFRAPADLETGYYMLVTGSRLASGSVLGNVSFFNVRPDSTTETNLTMRDNSEAVRVIGSFDSESKFTDAATGAETSVLTTAGRGYFVIGLLCVGQEPTDHALKDIAAKAAELEAWGRSLILLFPDEGAYRKYTASPAAPLPATVTFGIDRDGSVRRRILEAMQLPGNVSLPVFLIGDTFNRVVFESHGYTIGLGDRLLYTIHQL